MVIRTFIDKANTLVKNSNTNTGLNPVTELYYGSKSGYNEYSRFIFHFDETRLKSLYQNKTITDLTKLTHTLRMTNTGSFDTDLLNGIIGDKDRASSFDLIFFKLTQEWDNGSGYDFTPTKYISGDNAYSNGSSNWVNCQTGIQWSGGSGIYSGVSTTIIGTQHFDKGNENISINITDYVNGLLSGDTNYGLGIAYSRAYEQMTTFTPQCVGFFTNNTQTFYQPFIETTYTNTIVDDRNSFYLDKPNKLYLYVNLAGNPTNLDSIPSVNILDQDSIIFSSYTTSDVIHVTKGVYSIEITVPTNSTNTCTMYNDIWSGIVIKGISRPDIELSFVMKDSLEYYSIGNTDLSPKKIGVNVSGVQNKEKIKRGDTRKVIVSARIPYTIEQSEKNVKLEYRIWVTEGNSELTVIDFHPLEITNNNFYFLLDTLSLLSGVYYLDILATSNLETTTLKNVLQFTIVNQVELR